MNGNPTSMSLGQQIVSGLTFRNFAKTMSLLGLAAVTIGMIYWGIFGENTILDRLRDPEFARGLITFIVAIGTILIALLLTVSNMFGEENPADEGTAGKERFNRGKEILTILVGILGTIIGFYYGSTESKMSQPLPQGTVQEEKSVADLRGDRVPFYIPVGDRSDSVR